MKDLLVALALAGLPVACDNGPTGPTESSPSPHPTLRELRIEGSLPVAPGETYQLRATAIMYLPDIFERLTASTYLGISGTVVTTALPASLSGTLDGSIEFWDSHPRPIASCRSTGHQFVLSR